MLSVSKKKFVAILVLVAILGGGFSLGGALLAQKQNGTIVVSKSEYDSLVNFKEKYGKLDQLYRAIDDTYYKPIPKEDLIVGMYKGLFAGIGDPYSTYLTAAEYESSMVNLSSEFEGIGINFSSNKQGSLVIISTWEGGPADKAGLMAGDVITKVDDIRYDWSKISEAGSALRGKAGTRVKVTILRSGEAKDYVITRENIVKHMVTTKILDNNIGYIKIAGFETETDKDFENELRSMELKGVKGLIIDLRGNGGGLIKQGIHIADMLLPEGVITYLEDRDGNQKFEKSDGNATNLPYVVLVNGGTASTSEILSAAIKDMKTGPIVGNKTYGKGIVQSIVKLKDGDALKLTTMQYFSPKGKVIHENGVEPDYLVDLVPDDPRDYQLEKAVDLLLN